MFRHYHTLEFQFKSVSKKISTTEKIHRERKKYMVAVARWSTKKLIEMEVCHIFCSYASFFPQSQLFEKVGFFWRGNFGLIHWMMFYWVCIVSNGSGRLGINPTSISFWSENAKSLLLDIFILRAWNFYSSFPFGLKHYIECKNKMPRIRSKK